MNWPVQLSAGTAARLKRLHRASCGREEETMLEESYVDYEVFCNFTTLKNACRIRNHFYWKFTAVPRHISQGTHSHTFSKLSGQSRSSVVYWYIKQTKVVIFLLLLLPLWALFMWIFYFYFLSLPIAIYNYERTRGGLRDLMEQSVWISCRIFVRLELSTVVFLTPSVCLSPGPCGWLPYIYKSPGTHAYILKQSTLSQSGKVKHIHISSACLQQSTDNQTHVTGHDPSCLRILLILCLTNNPTSKSLMWATLWFHCVFMIVTNRNLQCLWCFNIKTITQKL